MTREHLRRDDPALAAALDAWSVPPLPARFAERVTSAARTPRARPPRDRRGAWGRRRSFALGLAAAGLMSATAAAAGLFGEIGVTVPALSRLVASVAPAIVPEPVAPPRVERRAERRVEAPTPVEVSEAQPMATPVTLPDSRQERAAERRADRIERRIAERERRGLPVPPRMRDPSTRLPPEISARYPRGAAVFDRAQELRRARRDGVEPASPVPGVEPTPRRRWRDMSAEERAEARNRLLEWRARRAERLDRQSETAPAKGADISHVE